MAKRKTRDKEKIKFTIMIISSIVIILSPIWFLIIEFLGWFSTASTIIMTLFSASIVTFFVSIALLKGTK